ncbi:MAG: hypothetical protein U9Q38_01845 [Thermodesulfobacteriota bacterium]|nr:hypothetical protein [Thermodesulfobacteriota bacterium]
MPRNQVTTQVDRLKAVKEKRICLVPMLQRGNEKPVCACLCVARGQVRTRTGRDKMSLRVDSIKA